MPAGDTHPQTIPPAVLDPHLRVSTAFRSMFYHFYNNFDRTTFPESDYPVYISDSILFDERYKQENAIAWILCTYNRYEGGKMNGLQYFQINMLVKRDHDWGYKTSFKLADEIARIFESAIAVRDFSTTPENPPQINNYFMPCAIDSIEFEDGEPRDEVRQITALIFAKVPRCGALFERIER